MSNAEWLIEERDNILYNVAKVAAEGHLIDLIGAAAARFERLDRELDGAEATKDEAVEYVLNRLRDAVHEHLAKDVPYRAFSGDPVEEEGRIGYCKGQQRLASVMLGSIEGIRHGLAQVKETSHE